MANGNLKEKYKELFGEEDAIMTAPTLRDVAPGLIDTGGAKFTSKELNKRRSAVSSRFFRNPRVRSQQGAFESKGPVQSAAPSAPAVFTPSSGRAPLEGADTPYGSNSPQEQFHGGIPGVAAPVGSAYERDSGSAYNMGGGGMGGLGNEMFGNQMGGAIGRSLGMGALTGVVGGLAMGAPLSSALTGGLGSAVSGLFSPMGLLGLANTGIGTSMAIDDAKEAAVFSEEPEVQENVMKGVFQSQPKTLTGQLAGKIGLTDPGIQPHEAVLAGDSPSQYGYDKPSIDPSTNPDWSEEVEDTFGTPTSEELINSTFGDPLESLADSVNRQTRTELDTATAEYDAPSFLENLGFEAPDQATVTKVTTDPVERGFIENGVLNTGTAGSDDLRSRIASKVGSIADTTVPGGLNQSPLGSLENTTGAPTSGDGSIPSASGTVTGLAKAEETQQQTQQAALESQLSEYQATVDAARERASRMSEKTMDNQGNPMQTREVRAAIQGVRDIEYQLGIGLSPLSSFSRRDSGGGYGGMSGGQPGAGRTGGGDWGGASRGGFGGGTIGGL